MQKNSKRNIVRITKWIISIIAVVMLAISFVYFFGNTVKMDNHSMSKTINVNENVLVDKLKYKIFGVDRFDIIYFTYSTSNTPSIKRVVGLPGEQIRIDDGSVIINGESISLPEGMSAYDVAGIAEEYYTLGDDEYFVLGDNSDASEDSRFNSVGNIKKENIIGKVWLKIKPFGTIG